MTLELEVASADVSPELKYNLYENFKKFHSYISEMPAPIKVKLGISEDNYQEFFITYLNNPSKSLFRKTETADHYLTDYWVATVSGKAKFLDGFLSKEYKKIDKRYIEEFYKTNIRETNLHIIQNTLLDLGIYLIYENAASGTKVDGVSLIVNGKPVIGMSLRMKSLDSFWFTLLHELSHITLHFDELDEPIVDYFDDSSSLDLNKIEKQANRLAREVMIPNAVWRTIKTTRNLEDLKSYSKLFEIHPCIIAGRLSFENNDWATYSKVRMEHKIEYKF